MRKPILNLLLVICSFCLLISCNNSKDKKNTDDAAATKTDTAVINKVKEETPPVPTSNPQDYSYDATSVISGTLTTETFYGPPGYGEFPKTDSREEFYMLTPEKPVNVISNETGEDATNETKNNVSKIQVMMPDNINAASYKNKKVRLTGTFFGAHTGHHHTDVIMDVQKVE